MKLFLVKSVLNLFSSILCSILKQQGGAVDISNGGSGTFASCEFTDNTAAESNGGAVNIDRGGSGTFTSCAFTGNTAGSVSSS